MKFQAIKMQKDIRKNNLTFTADNSEEYNLAISLLELKQALQKSIDSAVGPDDIHCKLLPNLPKSSLSLLLTVFNSFWES